MIALIGVLHLCSENVAFKRLGCLVLLVPGYVLFADGVQLFLNHEVALVLALGRELHHLH